MFSGFDKNPVLGSSLGSGVLSTITGACSSVRLERTPDKREVDSSILSRPTILGGLAQLGERLVCNQEVTGSIPVFSTNRSLLFFDN